MSDLEGLPKIEECILETNGYLKLKEMLMEQLKDTRLSL